MPKPETFMVTAKKGCQVRIEGRTPMFSTKLGRDVSLMYFGDEPLEVPNTMYYRKRLRAGDLIESKASKSVIAPKKVKV